MSTRFYQATNHVNPEINPTHFHDTETPNDLFIEMVTVDPNLNNWTVNLLNYKGDIMEPNISWKNIRITITLGDLFNLVTPKK